MKKLNQYSGMPQMLRAFAGWTSLITLTHRKEFIVDGLLNYANTDFTFRGTIQPLSPEQLEMKPEGQRSWEWLQIHCYANQSNKFMQVVTASNTFIPGDEYSDILKDNDQIVIGGQIYKIMAKLGYQRNGFIEYHLVKDYQA